MDTLPVSFKYGDVAFRWTEKVKGDLTGRKYQLPGEELEPDALITVSDDNDLQVSRGEACLPSDDSTPAGARWEQSQPEVLEMERQVPRLLLT